MTFRISKECRRKHWWRCSFNCNRNLSIFLGREPWYDIQRPWLVWSRFHLSLKTCKMHCRWQNKTSDTAQSFWSMEDSGYIKYQTGSPEDSESQVSDIDIKNLEIHWWSLVFHYLFPFCAKNILSAFYFIGPSRWETEDIWMNLWTF